MSQPQSQHYIGIKQIFAWPEERQNGVPGYHVVYDKGTPREYHSWSPKDVFEAAYLPMGEANDGSRVTQEMVDGFTRLIHVTSADNAAVEGGSKMTVGYVELANGTLYAESSACVDPKNYDQKIGAQICLDRAKERAWHMLGFALQWARRGLKLKKG